MTGLTIRRLKTSEADVYRRVRLEALKESPKAFSTSYEQALARSEESWVAQAESAVCGSDRAIFVAVEEAQPVGVAAVFRDDAATSEGELLQMWVAPSCRGKGVADQLLSALTQWAVAGSMKVINAEVTAGNDRALGFYQKHGFRVQARDANSWLMVLELVR
ncbi:MAG: GNAT family N-acetyltransferase [Verrucomicrobiaceae bacterium]|nr:GNAT family N-acetyltransferase [Verrucomicrobiaceae bacterium]